MSISLCLLSQSIATVSPVFHHGWLVLDSEAVVLALVTPRSPRLFPRTFLRLSLAAAAAVQYQGYISVHCTLWLQEQQNFRNLEFREINP